jgi:hypothetical protein
MFIGTKDSPQVFLQEKGKEFEEVVLIDEMI